MLRDPLDRAGDTDAVDHAKLLEMDRGRYPNLAGIDLFEADCNSGFAYACVFTLDSLHRHESFAREAWKRWAQNLTPHRFRWEREDGLCGSRRMRRHDPTRVNVALPFLDGRHHGDRFHPITMELGHEGSLAKCFDQLLQHGARRRHDVVRRERELKQAQQARARLIQLSLVGCNLKKINMAEHAKKPVRGCLGQIDRLADIGEGKPRSGAGHCLDYQSLLLKQTKGLVRRILHCVSFHSSSTAVPTSGACFNIELDKKAGRIFHVPYYGNKFCTTELTNGGGEIGLDVEQAVVHKMDVMEIERACHRLVIDFVRHIDNGDYDEAARLFTTDGRFVRRGQTLSCPTC